jgi:transposase
MLIPPHAQLFLSKEPIDMRKSFEGLTSIINQSFPGKLMTCYFLFINKRQTSIKVLYWDLDGFAIWYKRLEKGTFSRKALHETLTRKEYLMLLEGITPKQIKPRYTYV